MPPTQRAQKTDLRDLSFWKLTVPFVLDFGDLVAFGVDQDFAVDGLLLADALDHVSCLEVHFDGVAGARNLVVQALDFRESGLKAVPLRLELLAALGNGQRVREGGIIFPELQFGERRATSEEVEDAAYECLLVVGERDAGAGLDVCVLNLEFS